MNVGMPCLSLSPLSYSMQTSALMTRSFRSSAVACAADDGDRLDEPGLYPAKTYSNTDKEKESIYEDNRKKCGVYR